MKESSVSMADKFLGNITYFLILIKFSVGKKPRQNKALNVHLSRIKC
jgi:hypothetical protein